MANKYLATELNDHLAGATVGLELAKRAAGQYRGSELGAFLDDLRAEIEEDRETLLEIISAFGVSPDRAKIAVAWIGEKAGRLKPNGHLLSRSPHSSVVELEGLSLGIEGKRLLWTALAETHAEEIGAERLAELIARAERQRAGVERHRIDAARAAWRS